MQFRKNSGESALDDLPDRNGAAATGGVDQPDRASSNGGRAGFAESRGESVIDRHSMFDGHFETEQDMRIMGTINGEVVCRGQFTVDPDGIARTRVEAHDAVIRGHLEGDIVCSGRLLLGSTAVMVGTMRSATLVVEEGAKVKGNVETTVAPLPATAPGAAGRRSARGDGLADEQASDGQDAKRTRSFAFVPSDEPGRGSERN